LLGNFGRAGTATRPGEAEGVGPPRRRVRIYDTDGVKCPQRGVGIRAKDLVRGYMDDIDLTMVTMSFDAVDPGALQAVLARYVVLSRGHPGCRNIDLALSTTHPDRFVLVQKWASPADQRAHFDSPEMVDMARACTGLLRHPPEIDLLEPISAHDLI
jgi:quinol monooxygenase YgiN